MDSGRDDQENGAHEDRVDENPTSMGSPLPLNAVSDAAATLNSVPKSALDDASLPANTAEPEASLVGFGSPVPTPISSDTQSQLEAPLMLDRASATASDSAPENAPSDTSSLPANAEASLKLGSLLVVSAEPLSESQQLTGFGSAIPIPTLSSAPLQHLLQFGSPITGPAEPLTESQQLVGVGSAIPTSTLRSALSQHFSQYGSPIATSTEALTTSQQQAKFGSAIPAFTQSGAPSQHLSQVGSPIQGVTTSSYASTHPSKFGTPPALNETHLSGVGSPVRAATFINLGSPIPFLSPTQKNGALDYSPITEDTFHKLPHGVSSATPPRQTYPNSGSGFPTTAKKTLPLPSRARGRGAILGGVKLYGNKIQSQTARIAPTIQQVNNHLLSPNGEECEFNAASAAESVSQHHHLGATIALSASSTNLANLSDGEKEKPADHAADSVDEANRHGAQEYEDRDYSDSGNEHEGDDEIEEQAASNGDEANDHDGQEHHSAQRSDGRKFSLPRSPIDPAAIVVASILSSTHHHDAAHGGDEGDDEREDEQTASSGDEANDHDGQEHHSAQAVVVANLSPIHPHENQRKIPIPRRVLTKNRVFLATDSNNKLKFLLENKRGALNPSNDIEKKFLDAADVVFEKAKEEINQLSINPSQNSAELHQLKITLDMVYSYVEKPHAIDQTSERRSTLISRHEALKINAENDAPGRSNGYKQFIGAVLALLGAGALLLAYLAIPIPLAPAATPLFKYASGSLMLAGSTGLWLWGRQKGVSKAVSNLVNTPRPNNTEHNDEHEEYIISSSDDETRNRGKQKRHDIPQSNARGNRRG